MVIFAFHGLHIEELESRTLRFVHTFVLLIAEILSIIADGLVSALAVDDREVLALRALWLINTLSRLHIEVLFRILTSGDCHTFVFFLGEVE